MRKRKKQRSPLNPARHEFVPPEIVYDLLDRFIIPDAAPLADPLPASHVGSWQIVADTGSNLDVADSTLEFNGAAGASDPRIFSTDSFARVAGRAFFWRARIVTGGDSDIFTGIDAVVTARPNDNGWNMRDNGDFRLLVDGTVLGGAYSITVDTDYDFALICRDTGAFYFMRGGTEYPIWTLIWVDDIVTSDPVFLGFSPNDAGVAQSMTVAMASTTLLTGVFSDEFGIIGDRLAGARSAGDTFSHPADCFIEFVETTVPSALQTELSFRIQDATNRWKVTVDSAGDLDLDEVVAGVPTQRGTAAAVIVDGERIGISAVDELIQVSDTAARQISYAVAANFKLEMSGELDTEGTTGAVDDIVTWPATAHHWQKYFEGA